MKRLPGSIIFTIFLFFTLPVHAGQMRVFVSIAPQKYFMLKIGGSHITASVMVGTGDNPATYEPSPSQMTALAGARAYFAIGVPFESAWLPRIAAANPAIKIIHTEQGIEKKPINRKGSAVNVKGQMPDPHIWLSPPLVMLQARTIAVALADFDPEHASQYLANFRAFIDEITATDAAISIRLAPLPRPAVFLTFHPSWGYFADAYGLEQVSIEADGKSPKPAALGRLIEFAKKKKIKTILVQPQFSTRAATIIAKAINGKVITADPLAYDWQNNLIKFSNAIAGAAR
ncbi:MAG: zinc ABC transporter solute-binding protein [Deltaproteobacteria bacterium]|nr:zinc ABC transporter solute-binding protein [Deltaproteobacteria bacterium]